MCVSMCIYIYTYTHINLYMGAGPLEGFVEVVHLHGEVLHLRRSVRSIAHAVLGEDQTYHIISN